jgi:hypothetical protein
MSSWLTIATKTGGVVPIPETMDPEQAGLAYGTTVPQLLDRLDRIAQHLGVNKLEQFIAKNPRGFTSILKEAEREGNAVLASAMRAELSCINDRARWHEPESARATISSLKEFLASNPNVLTQENSDLATEWTLWDLEAYDRILASIEEQGEKFAFVERN